MAGARRVGPIGGGGLLALGVLVLGAFLVVGIASGAPVTVDDATSVDRTAASTTTTPPDNVSEAPYVEPAPEPDDEYFEATDPDGDWISYVNPRDQYRSPYLGDGSGKICVTLVNEAGDPITGETVPNTTVTVPTGDSLSWHPDADPMVVQYPLTDHYERPLDADQFGTTPELPQGDGYMDSHCIEMHGLPEDATVEYGEAQVEGEHADDVEVVGYVQQANDAWDSDVDPIEDAESYAETGGWTMYPDGSHGQAVVVLQLDRDPADGEWVDGEDRNESNETDRAEEGDGDDGSDGNESDDQGTGDETEAADDAADDQLPGFGATVAIGALAIAALLAARR